MYKSFRPDYQMVKNWKQTCLYHLNIAEHHALHPLYCFPKKKKRAQVSFCALMIGKR